MGLFKSLLPLSLAALILLTACGGTHMRTEPRHPVPEKTAQTDPPETTFPETELPETLPAETTFPETEPPETPPTEERHPPDATLERWMEAEGVTFAQLEDLACTQLVLVVAQDTDGVETVTTCYEKNAQGDWASVLGLTELRGWTGSAGIMHNRLRNTNTSPAGLWPLGILAFGNSPRPEGLRLPWQDVTPNSDWVCDGDSPYFNTWQERDDPSLEASWNYDDVEHLEDYPKSYAYACVIGYNLPPDTVPDRGCAIFFHCATGPTGGCIGLPEDDLVSVLLWLNPRANPQILITGYENPR